MAMPLPTTNPYRVPAQSQYFIKEPGVRNERKMVAHELEGGKCDADDQIGRHGLLHRRALEAPPFLQPSQFGRPF